VAYRIRNQSGNTGSLWRYTWKNMDQIDTLSLRLPPGYSLRFEIDSIHSAQAPHLSSEASGADCLSIALVLSQQLVTGQSNVVFRRTFLVGGDHEPL
jgi:hypothetical protein